jgi:hypothetical protein
MSSSSSSSSSSNERKLRVMPARIQPALLESRVLQIDGGNLFRHIVSFLSFPNAAWMRGVSRPWYKKGRPRISKLLFHGCLFPVTPYVVDLMAEWFLDTPMLCRLPRVKTTDIEKALWMDKFEVEQAKHVQEQSDRIKALDLEDLLLPSQPWVRKSNPRA